MAKATQRDETVYECAVPHAIDADGTPRSVRHGELLRADDPAVVSNPQFFAAVGTPTAERPQIGDFVKHGQQTQHNPIPSGWRKDREGKGKAWPSAGNA